MNYNIARSSLLLIVCLTLSTGATASSNSSRQIDSLKSLLSNADADDSTNILTETGRLYYKQENFKLALESFYQAFRISEKTGNKKSKAALTNNIAAIYYETGDLNKALDYFIQSLEIERETGTPLGVSKSLNNIAIIYNELDQLEKALEYYQKALMIRDSLDDDNGRATVFNNIGLVYFRQKDYKKAIRYYTRAKQILSKNNDLWSMSNTLGNLARAHLFLENYDEAIKYAKESIVYADSTGSVLLNVDNYEILYNIYKSTSDHQKALYYVEKYDLLKDSLNSAELTNQINDIKIKYETARKAKENELLKSEKQAQEAIIQTQQIFVVAILVVLILVSLIAYVLYKNSIIKKESIKILQEQNGEIERKKGELEKLNQVKNKIFSVISHEIKSPLSSLIGTVNLLTSGFLSPEEFFKLSTDLKQKVNQTSNFLNNILIWSKAQMQGINPTKEEFFLDDLINETIDLLKEQADIKGVEIERECLKQQPIIADKNLVSIVVKNLVSNAIKFTRAGKKVTIKTYRRENDVVVQIEDQGVGIPEEVQSKIFGRESVSTSGTADEVGTGLGLILSKMLVEETGGEIWLESKPEKGSTFSFSIP